jgi:phosphatidylserine decarboxylase
MTHHSYIHRESGEPVREALYADRIVSFLYSSTREHAPSLFRVLTGARISSLIGYLHFDNPISSKVLGTRFVKSRNVNLEECTKPSGFYTTARRIFERQIKYWDCRPLDDDPACIVSPSDSFVLIGSLENKSNLYLKDKFFSFEELLGPWKKDWLEEFREADFAVFRLTPDKYHYNHTPVSGEVVDFYEIQGDYHSCNPAAIVEMVTPFSKNRRTVTIIQTDVEGGSRIGLVAMIEVVALGIGGIRQCYSQVGYDNPVTVTPGIFLHKGKPKSLYQPGSSTNVLLFQKNRIRFTPDLETNLTTQLTDDYFSVHFGKPLVETETKVRSTIAFRADSGVTGKLRGEIQ